MNLVTRMTMKVQAERRRKERERRFNLEYNEPDCHSRGSHGSGHCSSDNYSSSRSSSSGCHGSSSYDSGGGCH